MISISTFCRPFHIFSTPEGLRIVARGADGTEFEAERIAGSSQGFRIEGVPAGTYTIEATSPVHEPWTKDGVEPGDKVSVTLRGGARLALTVLDGTTEKPIDSYRLRIQFNGSRSFPNSFTVLERGKAPPVGGLFEGLIPWDVTLLVDAEGFAPLALRVGELQANVTTSAEARLTQGGDLDVLVVDGAGKPAAGAKVALFPSFQGYDPRDVFSGPRDNSERQALRAATVEVTVGADGRASFDGLTPGAYGLLATAGSLEARKDRVEVVDGARAKETLAFPRSGSLAGRLTGGAPGSFVGVRVRARSIASMGKRHRRSRGEDEPGTAAVGADGTFLIDPLLVGSHQVELYLPSRLVAASNSSSSFTTSRVVGLGKVDVLPGEPTKVAFDGADFVPASVTVTARRNGELGAGLTVRIQEKGGNGWDGAVLSAEGKTRFAPIFPGEWQVTARSLTDRWTYSHTEVLDLAPGQEAAMEISFETARGRLRVLDAATSLPVASRQIYINGSLSPMTDAEGWLDLEYPLGPLTLDGVRPWPEPSANEVTIDWRRTGPSVDDVTLTIEDDDWPGSSK